MPFNAALTAGQITQVRQTDQFFEHYLLVNPNDIVWQAQVNENLSSTNYAEFEWVTTLQGVRTNVRVGQVVLITTSTTDFSSPVIRGRVRLAPGATTFYINESGTNLTTSMYLTVFDDFDLVEKIPRVGTDGTLYKDYDLTWSDLPPSIGGLQSVYVDLSGDATVTWSFTPTATAHASGASITTWAWDVEDGTITVGSSSTQNITVQFPGAATNEHRWIHLTVTDSNSNTTTIHFEVYTVNKNSSAAVFLDSGNYRINGTLLDGWNAECTAWDNTAITDIMDETRVTLACIADYNGTKTVITSNILLVGRFRRESGRAVPDEKSGNVSEVNFTIEGFAAQLGNIPAPSVYIVDNAAPSSWGQVVDPTPTRAIIYYLAFHTTVLSLCSFSSDDLSAFIFGDLSLGETSGLDNLNKQADSVNGLAFFAPSGEITIRRKVSYLSNRGSVVTVHNFTTADVREITGFNLEYGESVGQVEAGGVVYNSTRNEVAYKYIARAPAQSFGSGHETAQLNGQILAADATEANARTEIGGRAAAHLAYSNPKARMSVSLMDGFHFIYPALWQRYTFTLAATDTARGRVYTTSNYWQLVSVSITLDTEHGAQEVSAEFEAETTGANAGVSVTLIPDVNSLDFDLPGLGGYDFFPDDPLVNYPIDTPALDLYFDGQLDVLEPTPPEVGGSSGVGEETFNLSFRYDQTYNTTRASVLGETYVVIVEGDANIAVATFNTTYDLTASDGGWNVIPSEAGCGNWVAASGWEDGDETTGDYTTHRGSHIYKLYTATITHVGMTFDLTKGTYATGDSIAEALTIGTQTVTVLHGAAVDGGGQTLTWDGSEVLVGGIVATVVSSTVRQGGAPAFTGSTNITSINVQGTTGSSGFRGDAFYYGYDSGSGAATLYGAGLGLLVDTIKPGTIPPYNGSHRYEFTITGTGAVFAFNWHDSDFSDNQNRILRVTIRGLNMGATA